MEILNKDNGKKGSFYVEQEGKVLAEMSYLWINNKMIIEHTDVSSVLAGKGVGKQLVQKAVEFARERDIKIMSLCPFAKSVFEKVADFKDVYSE
jgi:predicted GNAT family acetyltransferase